MEWLDKLLGKLGLQRARDKVASTHITHKFNWDRGTATVTHRYYNSAGVLLDQKSWEEHI